MSRRLRVTHRTRYRYDDEVTASYGRAWLTPRATDDQQVLEHVLEVDPAPAVLDRRTDVYGNESVYLEVLRPHRALEVVADTLVAVDRAPADLAVLDDRPWTAGPPPPAWPVPAGGTVDWLVEDLRAPSPLVPSVPAVRAFGESVFTPGRPLGEAVRALVSAVHDGFAYTPGSTRVGTTLDEVLSRRQGVCQDFSHLTVAVLRGLGFPARYVSGYLETVPPPGQARLQGADATHAWCAVLLPDLGWVDLDPTNDQLADDRYVVTAWGRDYADVPPLKGVVYTEGASSTLEVSVDVVAV